MEKSKHFNFYLPSRDEEDIADINQISENFRIIDNELVVDQAFDENSAKAVANRVVYESFREVDARIKDVESTADDSRNRITLLYEEVDAKIGDIETVLDAILAIQEELIGGASV